MSQRRAGRAQAFGAPEVRIAAIADAIKTPGLGVPQSLSRAPSALSCLQRQPRGPHRNEGAKANAGGDLRVAAVNHPPVKVG